MRALAALIFITALTTSAARASDGDASCKKAQDEFESSGLNGMGLDASLREDKIAAGKAAAATRSKGKAPGQHRAGNAAAYMKHIAEWKKAADALIDRERRRDAQMYNVMRACAPVH